jgi:hypothetical protein
VTTGSVVLPKSGVPFRPVPSARPHVVTSVAGVVAVLGNVLGVAFLHDMPSAYRLAALSDWVVAVTEQPVATSASAISFVLGLVGLSIWARQLGERLRTPTARTAATLMAFGALVNAAGTTTPLVQALHVGACGAACDAVGRALLGTTLALDGVFNLMLGVGLLLMASAAWRDRWTSRLMLASGIATIPVSAQAVWDPAANLLYIAAPLWLAVIARTSIRELSGEHGR